MVECTDTSARDKKVTELYVQVMKRFSRTLLAVRFAYQLTFSIVETGKVLKLRVEQKK